MQQTTTLQGASWFESPVWHFQGTVTEIKSYLPIFERRAFSARKPGSLKSGSNERFDMIVRKPLGDDVDYIPVGIVSKTYALVPHQLVLNAAVKALHDAEITTDGITADLALTQYGERMHLCLYLPKEYDFDPDDGHKMKIRLECLNSVDGNSRFRALMGWLRQVCSNGMTVGVEKKLLLRRHTGDMDIADIKSILTAGLEDALKDQKLFYKWSRIKVSDEKLTAWIEKPLQETWGFKAAARAYHISQTGHDAELIPVFEKQRPSLAQLKLAQPVPGCPQKSINLFDINQILAWLAKERRDLQEQLQWRQQIPGLMEKLAA